MQPTINANFTYSNQQYDTVYYHASNNYTADDIVIIEHEGESIIKRVVAVAGETVTITKVAGSESYTNDASHILESVQITITVTDANGNTRSSENFKNEPMEFEFLTKYNIDIMGKFESYSAIDQALKSGSTYTLIVPENKIYCLGDNRNHSDDSRTYGCFNVSDIKGELVLHIPHGKTLIHAIWNAIF